MTLVAPVTIYVELPDEAVQVWRPVLAEDLGEGRYRIIEQEYDRDIERWEFVPGDEVVCELAPAERGKILAATRRVSSERGWTLNTEIQALLREVVLKHLPDDAESLLSRSPVDWASHVRRAVRDAVGRELVRTGFGAESEPTPRGLALEELIDFLNRFELPPR